MKTAARPPDMDTFVDLALDFPTARNRHLTLTQPHQVLAVDDDPTVLKMLKLACRPLGFNVQLHTASGVHEAIDLSRRYRFRYDLVLLDHDLEGVSGWQLLDYLRPCLTKKAQALVYSGTVDSQARAAYQEREVKDILAKPLSLVALGFAIRRALEI